MTPDPRETAQQLAKWGVISTRRTLEALIAKAEDESDPKPIRSWWFGKPKEERA